MYVFPFFLWKKISLLCVCMCVSEEEEGGRLLFSQQYTIISGRSRDFFFLLLLLNKQFFLFSFCCWVGLRFSNKYLLLTLSLSLSFTLTHSLSCMLNHLIDISIYSQFFPQNPKWHTRDSLLFLFIISAIPRTHSDGSHWFGVFIRVMMNWTMKMLFSNWKVQLN